VTNTDEDRGAAGGALLAGASGMVGKLCLPRLLANPAFTQVTAVARRPLPTTAPRLAVVVTELDRLAGTPPVPARAALCALGTTIAKAGSQDAFRKVDHDGVVAFARWAAAGGASTFVLISSVGADPRSSTFYLRVKGETEEDVASIGFRRFVVLRPGLILGAREERRTGEAIAQAVMPAIGALLVGSLRRYRGIAAEQVAAAMVAAAADPTPGRLVWHHDEMTAAARP
jgi:uncharacterized protein YbjT (DUF2867 family)